MAVLLGAAHAEDWPARPIRILAPSTPGGAADLFSRLLCDQFQERFQQKCFVENRAGAGGLIATQVAAQAAPDGYTLTISSLAYHVIIPASNSHAEFDPLKDFTHIAYIGGPPNVFVVNPASGARTLSDVVTMAKAKAPLPYVSPGVGTLGHLLMESFAHKNGLRLQQIMTKGASQGMMDLMAGTIDLGSMTWTSALGQIRAKQVLPLVLSSRARLPEFPDVPTFADLGSDDLTAVSWFGLSAPAGLSPEIAARINRQVADILAIPEIKAKLDRDSVETRSMTPEAFTAFVASEIRKWGPLAKALLPKT